MLRSFIQNYLIVSVAEYCYDLLSVAVYSVTLEELYGNVGKSERAIRQELYRLVKKKKLVNLRQGFYLIVPPLYARFGQPPLRLYIDKLFEFLKQPYYVSFFTAARFHGVQHQAYQKSYIMTNKPQNEIKRGRSRIQFLTTTIWPQMNIISRRGEAGDFKLSDRALTSVDLIHHQNKMGGVNNLLAFLEELAEEMKPVEVENLMTWYPYESTLRRFGYLLQFLKVKTELIEPLERLLTSKVLYPVQLVPDSKKGVMSGDNHWNIDVNVKLESDL